jgi:hypothetical protein
MNNKIISILPRLRSHFKMITTVIDEESEKTSKKKLLST